VPRFRQIGEILRVMKDKQRIRNVGIVAHIDHGKTTLTDSLLVEAGLLSAEVAGSARVLDFLEEEQRRGITLKTANISLQHKMDGDTFVVNVVDTPGHVDFAGKVARALRAVDGAVVVVDAVEEVMAQTETVTREALRERVRPVLFVNKVDRLFTELQLSPKEMQEKLVRIVRDFNSLVDVYGEPEFREKWKVDPARGSVMFGSALHKWGFSLDGKNPRAFERTVLDAYKTGVVEKLRKLFPLSNAVLDMVVRHVPSPVECQAYRVPRVWKGDLESEVGKAMVTCDENGPLMVCVTNVQVLDRDSIATGRVFSGSVKTGDKVFLVDASRESEVKQVFLFMGAFRETVEAVGAGNVVGLSAVDNVQTGETFVDPRFSRGIRGFESFRAVVEPVMTIALEPRKPGDLGRLAEVLERLVVEDPSLTSSVDQETGQYLLGGVGELHLEVALSFLRRYAGDLDVSVSKPIVAYREALMGDGRTVLVKSLNKASSFQIKAEQLGKETVDLLDRSDALSQVARGLGVSSKNVWSVDRFRNVLVVLNKGLDVVRQGVVEGFGWACRSGPLCMEPLRGVKIVVSDADVSKDASLLDAVQVMRTVSRGILGSCLSAGMALLEPVYLVDLHVPVQWFGRCATCITKRRGKIKSSEQRAGVMAVAAFVPVSETFGLAAELRSVSSGHAFWQFSFDHWERVPERMASELIRKIRKKRGLAPEVPKPEMFVDEIH
jgi:elongation factor 2